MTCYTNAASSTCDNLSLIEELHEGVGLALEAPTPLTGPFIIPTGTARTPIAVSSIAYENPPGTFSVVADTVITIPAAALGQFVLVTRFEFFNGTNNRLWDFTIQIGFALGTGGEVIVDEFTAEAQTPSGGGGLVVATIVRQSDNRPLGVDFEIQGTLRHDGPGNETVSITSTESLQSSYRVNGIIP